MKTSINEYEVTIEGFNPALMNRLSREIINEKKGIPKAQLEEWEDANWEKKLYKDKDGNVTVPDKNILAMMQECSKKYQVSPPKQIGRTWTNYIKGAIVVKDVLPMKYSKIEPFGVMVNGNPSSSKKSSRVYSVRPMLFDWELTFIFQDSAGYLKEEIVQGILKNGGLLVGFGDWRPQYGRFRVKKVKKTTIEV